jgi:hypothetical protein
MICFLIVTKKETLRVYGEREKESAGVKREKKEAQKGWDRNSRGKLF